LDAAVVVAVVAMRMVEMAIDHIIDVIAVRDLFVSAPRAMLMAALDFRRATRRICRINRNHVLVDVIGVDMVQVAVVEIIDMPRVADSGMTAICTVLVGVVDVLLFRASSHILDLLCLG
jgi:hypothetical protein